jgi:hypothetical protein
LAAGRSNAFWHPICDSTNRIVFTNGKRMSISRPSPRDAYQATHQLAAPMEKPDVFC